MSEPAATAKSMRCPVCFSREIDVLLLHDGTDYYCVKCSYRGSEDNVREWYRAGRRKFRNIARRLTIDEIESI